MSNRLRIGLSSNVNNRMPTFILLQASPTIVSDSEQRCCAGLVNCTTIDWFTEWPADALYEVAAKQLADEDLGTQEVKSNMCQVCFAQLGSNVIELPVRM